MLQIQGPYLLKLGGYDSGCEDLFSTEVGHIVDRMTLIDGSTTVTADSDADAQEVSLITVLCQLLCIYNSLHP
jgi:hypothetical protein